MTKESEAPANLPNDYDLDEFATRTLERAKDIFPKLGMGYITVIPDAGDPRTLHLLVPADDLPFNMTKGADGRSTLQWTGNSNRFSNQLGYTPTDYSAFNPRLVGKHWVIPEERFAKGAQLSEEIVKRKLLEKAQKRLQEARAKLAETNDPKQRQYLETIKSALKGLKNMAVIPSQTGFIVTGVGTAPVELLLGQPQEGRANAETRRNLIRLTMPADTLADGLDFAEDALEQTAPKQEEPAPRPRPPATPPAEPAAAEPPPEKKSPPKPTPLINRVEKKKTPAELALDGLRKECGTDARVRHDPENRTFTLVGDASTLEKKLKGFGLPSGIAEPCDAYSVQITDNEAVKLLQGYEKRTGEHVYRRDTATRQKEGVAAGPERPSPEWMNGLAATQAIITAIGQKDLHVARSQSGFVIHYITRHHLAALGNPPEDRVSQKHAATISEAKALEILKINPPEQEQAAPSR